MPSLPRESELPQGISAEVLKEGREVDLQRAGDFYQYVQTWSLLSAFKIPNVIERNTGFGSETFLRPSALDPEAPEGFSKHDCLCSLASRGFTHIDIAHDRG